MLVYIRDHNLIPNERFEKIKQIFKESECPNESLKETFDRFDHMEGDNIVIFGNGAPYERVFDTDDL